MATKMTKRDYFAILRETFPADHPKYAETIAFIDHEVDLLTRKNSSDKKPTTQQVANEAIKTAIAEGMEKNRLYTISEIIKEIDACADLTNQRVSALMRQMRKERKVFRVEEKRKAYFRLWQEGDVYEEEEG